MRPNSPTPTANAKEILGHDGSLSPDAVRTIAQGLQGGLTLALGSAEVLAPDAEYRLREIIQDALKFMRHSHRGTLSTGDIDGALQLKNVEPVYGFRGSVAPTRGDTGKEPTQRGRGSEQVKFEHAFRRVQDDEGGLFFIEEGHMSLKSLIENPLPSLPLEPTMSSHWLAINGVQPAIAQNPLTLLASDGAITGNGLSRENVIPSTSGKARKQKKQLKLDAQKQIKPILKHELSKELQQYFEYVTTSLAASGQKHRNACLASIAEEPGLMQLLPYLTQFVHESCQKSLRNLPWLFTLMRLSHAIISNANFIVTRYLHQLLPSVVTCIVKDRLCANPRDNHWLLRDYSAFLISEICGRQAAKHPSLQPRITATLEDALVNPEKPMTTHYGAIVGLGYLGFRVVEAVIVPHLEKYIELIDSILDKSAGRPRSVRRMEAAKVYGALVWACGIAHTKRERGLKGSTEEDVRKFLKSDRVKVFPGAMGRYNTLSIDSGATLIPKTTWGDLSDIDEKQLLHKAENKEVAGA